MTDPAATVAQATPGPWHVETQPGDFGGDYITGHITSPLHTYCGNLVSRRDSITDPSSMTRADAYLIASAPDLLAEAKAIMAWLQGRIGTDTTSDLAVHMLKLQMAIAKAEGRES